jgi:hypothetical protein
LEAIPQPALQMLGHHEFNDQLMELERAFLLPPFASLMYDEGNDKYFNDLLKPYGNNIWWNNIIRKILFLN